MADHSSTLAGKSHGQRSLAGCSAWGRTESDTTEQLSSSSRGVDRTSSMAGIILLSLPSPFLLLLLLFPYVYLIFVEPIFEKMFFPLIFLWLCSEINWLDCDSFSGLYFVSLVYLFILTPMLLCLYYCSFISK